MRQVKIGKVLLTSGGKWTAGVAYPALTYVTHNGDGWWSKVETLNSEPSDENSMWVKATDVGDYIKQLVSVTDEASEQMQAILEAETKRVEAENGRMAAETQRQKDEKARQDAEAIRQEEETQRQKDEQSRRKAESAREQSYADAEERRDELFVQREEQRQNAYEIAEQARQDKEAIRERQEATRVSQEEQRQSTFEVAMRNVDAATTLATETAEHPTKPGDDFYMYVWDPGTKSYSKTNIFIKGEGFSIYKTYETIALMNADAGNVPDGRFVLISNDNVDDPDNAKLYVKDSGVFRFLVDMSGAIGFTGKTPQLEIGTVTNGGNMGAASASIVRTGTDADGNPTYAINLALPMVSYDDLTEAQKKDLQKPATDMIATLEATNEAVKTEEAKRVEAEAGRVEEWNTIKENATSATSAANDAATLANSKATLADTAASNANEKATLADTAASNANEKAGYAQTQGNYAKEQGDAAKVLNNRVSANETNIGALQSQVSRLEFFHDASRYAVAAWNNDDLNPNALEFHGDKQVVDDYKFMLIDTTDNTRKTTAWKELTRNNLLRYADGSYAPTVGITQDMYNECATNTLYVAGEDGSYTEVYASGSYDASAEWDIDKPLIQAGGVERTLYKLDSDGVTYTAVTHKLRPWETTDTKYTIGIGMDHPVYLLDNVKGKSGKTWQGLFLDPVTWDGIDVSPWKLEPTAISPCPVCTVGGKSRAFFFLYEGESYCAGYSIYGCTMFKDGRTYPRHTDMQQVTTMNYARANNADNTLPYPFAEGGYHALNTYNNALEVLYESRYIHGASMFGTGISSLDSSNNETNWLANGGARYRQKGSETWVYINWSTTMNFYTASDLKTKPAITACVNGEAPKEQCMESQMAFSYAMEIGVAEGEKFNFYGSEYWYKIVPDTTGVDKMNVRVYRIKVGTANLYNASGEQVEVEIEACLRMSLFGGANLSGDVFSYWGGGYEQVGTCVNTTGGSIGNPVKLYIQPDQLKWLRETGITKDDLGTFEFENAYHFAGDYETIGNSYAKARAPFTAWKTANGGSTASGMCFFVYDYNYWSSKLNQRVRIAARFRGLAYYADCSRRYMRAIHSASAASRSYAGSAQALIDAAGPLQAE